MVSSRLSRVAETAGAACVQLRGWAQPPVCPPLLLLDDINDDVNGASLEIVGRSKSGRLSCTHRVLDVPSPTRLIDLTAA